MGRAGALMYEALGRFQELQAAGLGGAELTAALRAGLEAAGFRTLDDTRDTYTCWTCKDLGFTFHDRWVPKLQRTDRFARPCERCDKGRGIAACAKRLEDEERQGHRKRSATQWAQVGQRK